MNHQSTTYMHAGRSAGGPRWQLGAMWVLLVSMGCQQFLPNNFGPPAPVTVPVSNPAHVGAVDPTFLWQQIVDTVDDYFRIASEQPARRENDTWLEGRLRTYPEVSGTLFEPWRRDTTRGYERLQSTFQTVRRTATVRVVPEPTGYLIDVRVIKEQEDIDNPQSSNSGVSPQHYDAGQSDTDDLTDAPASPNPATLGWYEIGRDRELEQRIMENILGRITDVEAPRHPRK